MIERNCPFIGLRSDLGTTMSYPTRRNCCHRVTPPKPIHPEHQKTHCLTFDHRHCPVLLEENPEKLPPEIAAR